MSVAPEWRGGIIAAGDGTRLRAGGWTGSKAMLPVGGRALIDHALDRFAAAGFDRVSVLLNEAAIDCHVHLAARSGPPTLDVVVRTTPSSFASFRLLVERLAGAPAILTTVDAILPADDFAGFATAAAALPEDAVGLGATRHVDDEAPLWADLDPHDRRVRRLGGAPAAHVTAGLYALPAHMPKLPETGFGRLREYLGWLVGEGRPVFGIELPLVFDVDRPGDVAAAERALAAWPETRVEAQP